MDYMLIICVKYLGTTASVTFLMSSAPMFVDEPLQRKTPDQPLDLLVKITKKDASRFMDALKHRRLVSSFHESCGYRNDNVYQ